MSDLNLQQREIVQAVYENQWVTRKEIARNTRFSRAGVKRQMPRLVERGVVDVDKSEKTYRYRVSLDQLAMCVTASLSGGLES